MQKFAVFNIADEIFGVAIERVVEIIKPQKFFTVPGLPAFVAGVISVRGAVIPLIDLRTRFGKEPSGKKERIIIIRSGQEKLGFLVDGIREIMSFAGGEVMRPPSIFKGFKTEYLTGLGKKGDMIVILLDIDNLLTSEEKIMLKQSMELIGESGAGTEQADQRR
ncbi:MAG: chemotaxis protein CheW [Nitrospiraceae bacterium]|nr:chemotaxis protein CheW [Nitrospiraceae bacterium]